MPTPGQSIKKERGNAMWVIPKVSGSVSPQAVNIATAQKLEVRKSMDLRFSGPLVVYALYYGGSGYDYVPLVEIPNVNGREDYQSAQRYIDLIMNALRSGARVLEM